MVKTKFAMSASDLVVPSSIGEARFREAGLAWLDMGFELFAQEVFSSVSFDWVRKLDGDSEIQLSLDSAKNFRTRGLQEAVGAPPEIFKRRERFDAAVDKLLSRTSLANLWGALANSHIAKLDVFYIIEAWEQKNRELATAKTYPRFNDSSEFLFYLTQSRKTTHPWL